MYKINSKLVLKNMQEQRFWSLLSLSLHIFTKTSKNTKKRIKHTKDKKRISKTYKCNIRNNKKKVFV